MIEYIYSERTLRHFKRQAEKWKIAAWLSMMGMFGSIFFFVSMIWSGCP